MKPITIITYNIDGLPTKLDLNDLPLILRLIAWIYKLIKKTTLITINDNDNYCRVISGYLASLAPTIVSVQEDFNYHKDLMSCLKDNYNCGKYSGGFDLKKLFSSIEIFSHFPLPRFKADGLNLLTDKNRVKVIHEIIVPWEKSYGYVSHANDLLTRKGFRLYELVVDNTAIIDVYNIHMDADFYNEETCPNVKGDINARKFELIQLTNFIIQRNNLNIHHPIIIIGDTNSSPYLKWDTDNIDKYLIDFINKRTINLQIKEVLPNNFDSVDRIFYINDLFCSYEIKHINCYADINVNMSDHKPIINTLEITYKDGTPVDNVAVFKN